MKEARLGKRRGWTVFSHNESLNWSLKDTHKLGSPCRVVPSEANRQTLYFPIYQSWGAGCPQKKMKWFTSPSLSGQFLVGGYYSAPNCQPSLLIAGGMSTSVLKQKLQGSRHNAVHYTRWEIPLCFFMRQRNKWLIGNSLKKRCSSRTVMLVISVAHCKGRTTSQTSWYLTNRRICGQTQESFEHYPVPPPRAQ